MNKANGSPKRRSYTSQLREEQSEQTRERILASVAVLMRAGDLEELSFATVAKQAGVSVPTVYRYFPSREALFEGIQEWLTRELKAPPFPKSWEELADGAPAIFAYYESAGDLFRTAMVTALFREVGHKNRRGRDRAIAQLMTPLTGHIDERRANAVHALIRLMFGFEGYSFMSERFGVTAEEAADVMSWATRALTTQLIKERTVKKKDDGRGKARGARRPRTT